MQTAATFQKRMGAKMCEKMKRMRGLLVNGIYPAKYRLFGSDILRIIGALKEFRQKRHERRKFEAAKPEPEARHE